MGFTCFHDLRDFDNLVAIGSKSLFGNIWRFNKLAQCARGCFEFEFIKEALQFTCHVATAIGALDKVNKNIGMTICGGMG